MEDTWLVYDPDCGNETFKTEEEAKAHAEKVLGFYRDDAAEGWDESVEQLVVAKITMKTEKFDEKKLKEGGHGYGEFDYLCDYKLVSA
jgi:hypothetical protein